MKRSELERILKKHGFRIKREGKEHAIWWNPENKREVQVPRSKKEIKTGTAAKILKDAGIKL